MTSCVVVSKNSIVLSSINEDKCYVCSFINKEVKNLTDHLGEAYNQMPLNNYDLQKACATFSSNEKLFAYNPNKGKLLSIWNADDWSLVENKTLLKHATKIIFTPKTHTIVVGDKKGDVYAFENHPVRILGHSSMVLDICISNDEKYIITCDSDEKVRVSHYPNGKNIIYYMMGHTAFVSGLCLFTYFILSSSGDSSLKLWNIKNGELVDNLDVQKPIRSIISFGDMVAVQFYDSNEIQIVNKEINENSISLKNIRRLQFDSIVLNMASYSNQIWIITVNSIHLFSIEPNSCIIENSDYTPMKNTKKTLEDLIKSFTQLEKTDLMIFLHKKMIDKLKRTEEFLNNDIQDKPITKRIKQN
ncbi:tRNA (guanine-N(7)-)-methyltransferase non-catalytic subunit wuho [Daktulosphaira vitifoliae]|uniref:tRNA (guanine-N(7)-)-methyltransferase non-catalytic subunit wuho n=1 Tax=Daktulosphaira vitifoliae TaxID=58002 RepID=UPI0021AA5462|nr:tRNA (guanine-N(7)-)-methyltransferase non-catalytic subunit wuho [Daktulosphaira vitifoliae]